MGQRGIVPTPTKILELRGSWQAKARMKQGEPKVVAEIPPAPDWLSPAAKTHYKPLAKVLHGPGILARTDQVALGLTAEALAQYIAARDQAAASPTTTQTVAGEAIHPHLRTMGMAFDRLMKACIQFGMTPAARARVISGAKQHEVPDADTGQDPKRLLRKYRA